ncbi:uncharacterized protein LOC117893905 [Drosophila subobscura]|uniref:uncharacterized protein LOC117893905 n=1 Tax=Drosophila subobscura TaxID=7241 RepID=UPI00155B39BF|nr:uncharacterized protein LOC117893905 [Drosophila subobscura]
MSKTTILCLNDYCLYAIFDQIELNCKLMGREVTEDSIRYADIINFASCCHHLNTAFLAWNVNRRRDIDRAFYTLSTSVCIDFQTHYNREKQITAADKKASWQTLVNARIHNTKLEQIILVYLSKSYCGEHIDVFEMTLRALRNKRTLRKLEIKMKPYSLDKLLDFGYLEILDLDV